MARGTWREDADDNARLQALNKRGWIFGNQPQRKQRIQLEDYTGFEDLNTKFQSPENQTIFGQPKTVEQRVEDYQGQGPGRVIIKGKTNSGPAGIYFYPDDTDFDKAAVKSMQGWNTVFESPSYLAPLVPMVGGYKAMSRLRQFKNEGYYQVGSYKKIPFAEEFTGTTVDMVKTQPSTPLALKQNLDSNFSPTVYDPAGLAQLAHIFKYETPSGAPKVGNSVAISRSREGKLIEERELQTANMATQNLKIDERKAKGKSYDTQARVMRRHQGTPTTTVGDLARPFVKASPVKDFSTRDVLVAYDKKTAAQKKEGAQIKKKFGLEATVDDHHIIQSFDSSEIGRLVREWNDPNEAADFYVWMVKEYKILSGDYDLNSAKLPTGPHRLKGGLHNVLKRFGFEDYWRELAVQNPMGLSKAELKVAFSRYADEVLYPTMRLMKELVEKHPAKGKFEHKGQYIPDYLVQDANRRLRLLYKKYDPVSGAVDKEQALDDLHTFASQQGWDTESRQWIDTEAGPIFSRPGFTKPPDKP